MLLFAILQNIVPCDLMFIRLGWGQGLLGSPGQQQEGPSRASFSAGALAVWLRARAGLLVTKLRVEEQEE